MNKKIVISLSVIAAVAAIVIGGTTAFFSDTETSTGNVFTAGTLEIEIKDISHAGEFANFEYSSTGFNFTLDDIKPLDSGTITYKLYNLGNEAHLCARVHDNNENPESADESLKSMLNFRLGDISGTFPEEYCNWSEWVSLGTMDANAEGFYSVNYCFGIYENGDCDLDDIDYNPAQGGQMIVDVEFYAVQTRHNEGFECSSLDEPEIISTAGESWPEINGAWLAKARYGGTGYRAELGIGAGNRDEWVYNPHPWISEEYFEFILNYDGDGNATFKVKDGNLVYAVPGADEKICITGKTSNESEGQVELRGVTLNGSSVGPDDGFLAQGTNGSRDIKHLCITGANLSGGFTLEGEIMFAWGDNPIDEGPAIEIQIEN